MSEYTPWLIQSRTNPVGWTTVGRTRRGKTAGTFVPHHHWSDRVLAEMHVELLNRGVDTAEARNTITALCSRAAQIEEQPT